MSTETITPRESDSQRYEAVLRIGEAISACRSEPEELARTLADEIGTFLQFDHLCVLLLKENSKEIESLVWGKGPIPLPDVARRGIARRFWRPCRRRVNTSPKWRPRRTTKR